MGDMREVYRDIDQQTQKRKDERRTENLLHLAENDISWRWVDKLSDHILINNEIDYYLGKTYWFNRKTGKKGYAMLSKLLGGSCRE